MKDTWVRMSQKEADARSLDQVWSALTCWRSYHPEDCSKIDALFNQLQAHEITARKASLALFDIQYASANRPKNPRLTIDIF